ncbi:hypothetical protein [Glaciihabitans sp. UYNi722]|uniref:hypothetical protein n=1 Tax=Glaciihabitans sp. UYNi722 TaxID=3156344 RepID=UPI00339603CD
MSGDIVVSGGGSSAVATEELFVQAQQLDALHARLVDCLAQLAVIDRVVASATLRANAPASAIAAEEDMDDASLVISRAAPRAAQLRLALEQSAEAYGFVERSATRLTQELAARFGWLFGMMLPSIALSLLPAIVGVAGGVAVGLALMPEQSRKALFAGLPEWFRKNSTALSDPRTVQLVRLLVMSVDDIGGGVLHLPPDVVHALGDEGLGIFGVTSSSAIVVGVGGMTGALAETPVTVQRSGTTITTAPLTFEERAARLPRGAAQVRIDRYQQADGSNRYEVYVSGTRDFSLVPGDQPWDMTSNMNSMAGGESGSYRAVAEAMRMEGIDADSPVVFNGHSQGGLIAAQLAGSGDYNTKGVFTLGAPAAQIEIPSDVPWVAVEHTDDLVPALAGNWQGSDPVLVRREVFADRPVSTGVVFPAHQIGPYLETARLIDGSEEERLVRSGREFAEFGGQSTTVESTLYSAERADRP